MKKYYSMTEKHQVTIPKEIREKVGLQDDDRVTFVAEGGAIIIRRVETMKEVAERLSAKIKRAGIPPATDKDIDQAREKFYREGMTWE